jgi:ParB family chromosome partitioning protein
MAMSEQAKETEQTVAKMSDDDTDERTVHVKPDKLADIPIDRLKEFANHPYKLLPYDELSRLADSIKEDGLNERIIVRPADNDTYEILSGHNRVAASKQIGKTSIAAVIRDVDDITAARIVVTSNSHRREKWLPSEYAGAFRLLMEKGNRMGKRPEHATEEAYQKTTRDRVANEFGKKGSFVQQHVRLAKLNNKLLDRVDKKQIPVSAGEQVSYLNHKEQETLAKILVDSTLGLTLRIKSAKMLRTASEKCNAISGLSHDEMIEILKDGIGNHPTKIEIPFESIKQYFKDEVLSEEEMVEIIKKALDEYRKI